MDADIEQYLNVRSASGASMGSSGALSFLLDTTGTPQVWRLDAPERWPEQLTFREERVTFASWSPTRPELVFGSDTGGDERTQLFRLAGDGSKTVPLTDAPDAMHWWGGWSHDGERVAFAANRRDEAVLDVYVRGRGEDDAVERVHEGDGWLTVSGWSPDDTRLALVESHSSFDQDVYVLDLASGERTHLTPHDGSVRYYGVTWGPDSDALYLVTDLDADILSLARIDVETGELGTVVDGGRWNVDGVAIDADTGRVVYSRNVDGYTKLAVGDLDGRSIERRPAPDLPRGVAGGVSFDDGAERFAVTVTASDRNPNVYVVDVETGKAERWTHASLAGIPATTFVEPDLVRYTSFDGREIPAFFSVPRGKRGERGTPQQGPPYPVIVDVHGGPESQRRPSFSPVTQYFLKHGYAVFEPNVRGSTGYGKAYTHLDDVERRMDAVADLRAGVEWLAEHPAADADRVAAMGASYGGFMVLAALTEYPELWAAGVDVVGIANFVTFLERTGDWRRELREAEYGSLADDREYLERISPVNNVERIRAPLLVLHGANDPRVPVGEAEQIAEEAGEHVPCELMVFDDEGHGFSKRANRITAYRTIVEFLDDHLVGR